MSMEGLVSRVATAALLSTGLLLGCTRPRVETAEAVSVPVEAAAVGRISASQLRRHVGFLASDTLAGREVGGKGIRLAEEYIATEFRRYGLRPVPGSGGYFLGFSLVAAGFDPNRTGLDFREGGRTFRADPGEDFRPFDFSTVGEVEAPVVFAGYGITAPEYGYDDYAGLDVAGKIVLVLRHEPGERDSTSPFDGTSMTDHALFTAKAQNARRHGAQAMLLVTDPLHHRQSEDLRLTPRLRLAGQPAGQAGGGRGEAQQILPSAQVSIPLVRRILAASNRDLEELQRAVDVGRRPAELPLSDDLRASLRVHRGSGATELRARNVAGFLPGGDPERAGEWIIVGAHHDHLGAFVGTGDTIYNGADDNASGTAAVLELARAFSSLKRRPARSLVFVTFSAEEEGLLGSRALLSQGLIPMDRLTFMLNLDMIGRNPDRPVQVYGDRSARVLASIVHEAAQGIDLDYALNGAQVMSASDHTPFRAAGIPYLALFTGTHGDYHHPEDEADALAYGHMAGVVLLAFETVRRVADLPASPRFVHRVSWLGIELEGAEVGGDTLQLVTGVGEGSPAEAAGLREGDTILAVAGETAAAAVEMHRRLESIEPGTSVSLQLLRRGNRIPVELKRPEAGYLGIRLAASEEERPLIQRMEHGPAVRVVEVLVGSPAARAGLRQGDVIADMAGVPIGMATLQERLAQLGAGSVVDLGVVRGRRRIEIQVSLGRRP